MRIAKTDSVTIISPDVVENAFHSGTTDLEAKLHEHRVKDSTGDCRLDDVRSIKTVNTTAALSALCQKISAIKYALSPESTLLLSNHISLQSPKITHRLQVERVNELDDVLPFHPVTFRMEIESNVFEINSFEAVDKLLVAVSHNCFFSLLFRQVYDCLWIISCGNFSYGLK